AHVWCFFFFSSRRRHTRCYRDWSSDVCSSDLIRVISDQKNTAMAWRDSSQAVAVFFWSLMTRMCAETKSAGMVNATATLLGSDRSEERRVGKECRWWWWPDDEKEKQSNGIVTE